MSKFLPRTTGIRKATRELESFAVVDIEYERYTLRLLPLRFISRVPFSSRRSLSPPSRAPIKGRSLLPERHTRSSSSSRHKVPITALLLRSSPSRLAACTAGRDSRPPEPHLLSPVREKGDKVFGERSARLLASSFFITDSDDDFFPDVHDLIDDMANEDIDPKSSATATAVPYVFFFLLDVLPHFLVLVLALHMLCSTSYMQLVLLF